MLVLALAGCASLGSHPLAQADEACAESLSSTLTYVGELGDEGKSIVVDGSGDDDPEEDQQSSLISAMCVLSEIDTPDSVIAKLEGTRALDGVRKDSFDEFQLTWSYHPSNGMDLIIEEAE